MDSNFIIYNGNHDLKIMKNRNNTQEHYIAEGYSFVDRSPAFFNGSDNLKRQTNSPCSNYDHANVCSPYFIATWTRTDMQFACIDIINK